MKKKSKIAIILGTRPEIIKMSPVIHECIKKNVPFFILHTGQHYSPNMDSVFFKDLGLPKPKYNLGLGNLNYNEQVGKFTRGISEILKKEKPNWVLVQGDTTTVLAGALAANKLGIKVAHHEAGLRSYDTAMLEEVNRILTDNLSDVLFAPTKTSVNNLLKEGIDKKKIHLTGNTVVDAVKRYAASYQKNQILKKIGLKKDKYFLVTAHRAENVDNPERLENILKGLDLVKKHFKGVEILYPLHPRTKKRIASLGFKMPSGINIIEPVGYFEMLQLQKNAKLIITDSGGVQEEAATLRVPLVTLRDNTERPETVDGGFNVLVPGVRPDDILAAVKTMLAKKHQWKKNPFGDGKSAGRIVARLS
ncbi:UDP-N-acetylglucosamine 2-epimerase [Candidatus Giovannonibacteria bacterium RIFCSPHIGHO2_01_FULL_45_33]|uniref:UDP-N-acetylglucosamine 2-epimerase n=1 Tax=Candidatus Giovannonibacteria bacterium RIFCSPLOWO2_01_FULL_45_34 TaxID=1798351 RepID=A0A1F5WZC9_9BACT|nr:MAG: UDP-N-acetylglucosamine 2-epimerase [Candidatus Giovannonibacteria bacterium RIFCSPHIGHO2_01_FULL_45_33]OGF70952.1 MAG: UDP-N-acetylglucosamine 2-epimerase [Candidatus Giovannonibacteria bacterium RIFCSPHIGHO2_02_FULL_44_11]OGF80671.1 MAG: UDP-N-acetylglucosamine 2-epimerase [Candidatus Giovannonibacteria bacterium RIFCSPLOWO2_01_FULL_45_34]